MENRHVDAAGEEEGGTDWQSSIDIYTLLCGKQTASAKCYIAQGALPVAL